MMGKRTRAKTWIVKWPTVPLIDEIEAVEPDDEEEAVDPNTKEAAIANAPKEDVVVPNAFEPKEFLRRI